MPSPKSQAQSEIGQAAGSLTVDVSVKLYVFPFLVKVKDATGTVQVGGGGPAGTVIDEVLLEDPAWFVTVSVIGYVPAVE